MSLADASWAVDARRLILAGPPLDGLPRGIAWFEWMASRPAFDRAAPSWRPEAAT